MSAIAAGDAKASDELLPLVYEELRRLARSQMARESDAQTLQPTALVHEAYLRLVGAGGGQDPKWEGRGHFFASAALAMRRILVERARGRARLKRGGDRGREPLHDGLAAPESGDIDLIALDDALKRLEIRERLQDADNPQVALAKGNLAWVLIKQDRPDEAEPLLDDAMAIYLAKFGERHPYVAATLRNRALICLAREDGAGAEALTRQALDIYREKMPTNADYRWRTNLTLASALEAQGKRDEAEKLLVQVHDEIGTAPDQARLRETARAQIEAFYRRWGPEPEAVRWAMPPESADGGG